MGLSLSLGIFGMFDMSFAFFSFPYLYLYGHLLTYFPNQKPRPLFAVDALLPILSYCFLVFWYFGFLVPW